MNDIVTIRKIGKFYNVFDEDIYIIFYFFNYKITNGRIGFPETSYHKVINTLEENSINYIVKGDGKAEDIIRKNNINNYSKFLKKGLLSYEKFEKTRIIEEKLFTLSNEEIDKIIKYIEEL